MCSCIWGIESFSITSELKPGSQEVKKGPKVPFLVFFDPPEPQPTPITTRIIKGEEHCASRVEALASACCGLYYSFQWVK